MKIPAAIIAGLSFLLMSFLGLGRGGNEGAISPYAITTGDNITLDFTSAYTGQGVVAGEKITFTVTITNQDVVSRNLYFYNDIPAGLLHIAHSPNLSYTTVLTWSDVLTSAGSARFTYTLQVTETGNLDDIPVTARVFNQSGGAQLVSENIILSQVKYVSYLPLIFKQGDNSSPSPTPTPVGAIKVAPVRGGTLQSQSDNYSTALAGGGFVAGSDVIDITPPAQLPYLNFSLIQCRFNDLVYIVHRNYFEFDTSSIPANFNAARLEFYHYTAYPGPPAHVVNVYRGTWTTLLLVSDTTQLDPAIWNEQGAMVGQSPGTTGSSSVLGAVNIPKSYINTGGVTKIALKTSTEGGGAPLSDSCFGGGQAGLGGGISIPYLYIDP